MKMIWRNENNTSKDSAIGGQDMKMRRGRDENNNSNDSALVVRCQERNGQ